MKKTDTRLLFKVEKTLGPLEYEVMKAVWDKNKTTVREMLLYHQDKKNLAYTTMMTIMDNLYKKGFLARKKIKKSYCYTPAVRKNYIIAISLSKVFNDLRADYGRGKILYSVFNTSLLPKINITIIPHRLTKIIRTYFRKDASISRRGYE